MRYVSTRGAAPALDFEAAMMAGLARDGGLYVPDSLPALGAAQIAALRDLPYEEAAFRILRPFVGDSFAEEELRGALERAHAPFGHPERAPLAELEPGHFLLELFHGPTLAFKDFAMRAIAQLMELSLIRSGARACIVGATSGDTGSAAIDAFRGMESVDVFILFPDGRVSDVQRRQMTTPAEPNVHAVAVKGDFDDCQALVKGMFNDLAFRDSVGLAGVNSINCARVLAQTVYYFTAAAALGAPDRAVSFTVPTGNFGNVLAGDLARRMGLPVAQLVVATNHNDILHRCLETAQYRPAGVAPSISPSMDIQVSSNFERALHRACGGDAAALGGLMADLAEGGFAVPERAHAALRGDFASGRCSEEETLAAIADVWKSRGMALCPHTAVGVKVARGHLREGTPMITLATAHAGKFPDAVERACGARPALPAAMAGMADLPERVTAFDGGLEEMKALVAEGAAR